MAQVISEATYLGGDERVSVFKRNPGGETVNLVRSAGEIAECGNADLLLATISRSTEEVIAWYQAYKDPKVGLHPFEVTYCKDENGVTQKRSHVGNVIVFVDGKR